MQSDETVHGALWVVLVACALSAAYAYYPFTAEDAYISLRYARHLTDGLGPIYNHGEAVNAMTSPLHVGLSSVILTLSDAAIWWNKSLGLLCVGVSGWAAAQVFSGARSVQLMTVALCVLPAPVLMWSVGGLETPFLLLAVSVSVFVLWRFLQSFDVRWYFALCVLGGLGFLLRYDAALFFATLILGTSFATGFKMVHLLAWVAGAALPMIWLATSMALFGDILPTSFHEKTPSLDSLVPNLRYGLLYLSSTGVLVALLIITIGGSAAERGMGRLPRPYRQLLTVVAIAIAVFGVYAVTMMTKHMMFQWRAVAPYFGAIAVVVGCVGVMRGASITMLRMATVSVMVLSGLSCWQIVNASVNGFSKVQEYPDLPLPHYVTFMERLKDMAAPIDTHWAGQNMDRPLRLFTPTAGILPYALGDAYIYSPLISFRHTGTSVFPYLDLIPEADYVHVFAGADTIEGYEDTVVQGYERVVSLPLRFDGFEYVSAIYFTPTPRAPSLTRRVYGP